MTETLSLAVARRIALAAQGFGARPAPDDRRKVLRAVDRTGLLQIDSVNAVVRSHYLPTYARQGSYARAELDRLQLGRRRRLFEYWGHEASLIPVEFWPLLQWRMARARAGEGVYGGLARFGRERADFIAAVLREIEQRGPLAAGELTGGGKGQGSWWGWSDGKRALEWLFWAGQVTTGARRGFERLYDLPERVLPAGVAGAAVPNPAEAQRGLLRIAARALGVATERDLRDYWRLGPAEGRAGLEALVEEGALLPVAVQGWRDPAYLDPEARRPRRVEATALLSPFDNLIWFRPRAERLWGFRFRLEIYTPAEKRVHGYYVLPFLHRERLQARLDVRSVRAAGRLDVHAVHLEPGADPDLHRALAAEVRRLADWLGLAEVSTPDPALAAALDG
ncbi:MAG: winged helix DNA-binding domain-containing protein [Proteobacteria bacterium]|nr:winged helix DNA-binding domain-containing protein [Pseudomonadota bacterium]